MSREMVRVENQFPKYSIAVILQMTAWLAGLLATVRLLGPQKSWVLFVVAYAFAPTIAMMVWFLLRRQSMTVRFAAAGFTLIVFAAAMMISCGLLYGGDAMMLTLLGTFIEWPGQVAILVCLFLMQRQSTFARFHPSPPSHHVGHETIRFLD